MTELPLDGAISQYFRHTAPQHVRQTIETADKNDLLNPRYPYSEELPRETYDSVMKQLQVELARLQAWVKTSGARVAIVFEGRDAAGKGGSIKCFTENMNPRGARIVALPKPSETEATQWYFQRYIAHLPARGELVFFDRSWYNRGVVEQVFGFCTKPQRDAWFSQVPEFEKMLVQDGIQLFKLWLDVGQATQLRRFLDRERDPLKQWKLSQIDLDGLAKWDAYSKAIDETLRRTDTPHAPWTVILADDKRRARVAAIRAVLRPIDYARKDREAVGKPDPKIAGGLGLWHG